MNNDKVLATGVRGGPSLKALEEVMRDRYQDLPIEKLEIYLIETVEAAALPFLAEQFNISGKKGFALMKTEDAKRELLSRAIELNRTKGTPYAIKEAVRRAGYVSSEITEQIGQYYDGKATYNGSVTYAGYSQNWACFSVKIDAGGIEVTKSDFHEIREYIHAYKNARSKLIYVDFINLIFNETYGFDYSTEYG